MSLSTFQQLSAQPHSSLFDRGPTTTASFRYILANAHRRQRQAASVQTSTSLGSLTQLHTSQSFAHDQIWHQLDIRNEALLPVVRQQLDVLRRKRPPAKAPKRRVTFAIEAKVQPPLDSDNTDNTDDSDDSDVAPDVVQKFTDTHHGDEQADGEQFFNETDMNAFAADAEQLARQGKLAISDEGFEDDASDDSDGGVGGRYEDFFDPPSHDQAKAAEANIKINTPLQEELKAKQSAFEQMENEIVEPKEWHLRGEVSAFTRPKDSLVDTEMEHDIAVRPKAFVHTDVSEAIEDVIKQRVADSLFDSVTPVASEEYSKGGKRKLEEEISQEKATEGLAEMYAREFSAEKEKEKQEKMMSVVVQRKETGEETKEQKVVNGLFERVNERLDALCNLHLAVNVGAATSGKARALEEMSVVGSNVKAIRSEEAIPDRTSDADLLTPHEVYSGEQQSGRTKGKSNKRRKKSDSVA